MATTDSVPTKRLADLKRCPKCRTADLLPRGVAVGTLGNDFVKCNQCGAISNVNELGPTKEAGFTPGEWEAYSGEDYTVVMLPEQVTENASIQVISADRVELGERIATALNCYGELYETLQGVLIYLRHGEGKAPNGWRLTTAIEHSEAALLKAVPK